MCLNSGMQCGIWNQVMGCVSTQVNIVEQHRKPLELCDRAWINAANQFGTLQETFEMSSWVAINTANHCGISQTPLKWADGMSINTANQCGTSQKTFEMSRWDVYQYCQSVWNNTGNLWNGEMGCLPILPTSVWNITGNLRNGMMGCLSILPINVEHHRKPLKWADGMSINPANQCGTSQETFETGWWDVYQYCQSVWNITGNLWNGVMGCTFYINSGQQHRTEKELLKWGD